MRISLPKYLLILGGWLFLVFFTGIPHCQAQQITRLEYFLNQDPGFGLGTNVPVSPGEDIAKTFPVDISLLPTGFHHLYLRFRNANGQWSMTTERTFYKQHVSAIVPEGQVPDITKGEFFFNTDPGFGRGTNIPLSPGQDLTNIILTADITALPSGFHHLYLRFRNANGLWGLPTERTFYKQNVSGGGKEGQVPDITKGEFFFDTDPGFGLGTTIPITSGQDLNNITLAADITALTSGFHHLYLRFKNANGQWSMTTERTFYKENVSGIVPEGQVPNITKGEFFFDTDPGYGRGTDIPLSPGQNLNNITLTADITALPIGFHQMYLRFKNAKGQWSMATVRSFFKESVTNSNPGAGPDITKGEYYIDTDPGYGQGTNIALTPGQDLDNLVFAVDMNQVSVGNHQLFVRFKNARGQWSFTSVRDFKVEPPAELYVTLGQIQGQVCAGAPFAVPFAVNAPFSSNNIFTVQLSNASGSFANPTNIGTLAGNGSDTIRATIPAQVAAGANYRVRIIASSPFDTTAASATAIVISRQPDQFISIGGKTSTCLGTEVYQVTGAVGADLQYTWQLSGGGTLTANGATATVAWTTAGIHTLRLTPANGCGPGAERILQLTVFEASPALTPTVTTAGRWLYAALASAQQGVDGYQWYRDGQAVTGATGSSYYGVADGSYTVIYTNACGQGSASLPVVLITKKDQTITFEPVPDKTFGEAPITLVAAAASGLPVTYRLASGPGTIQDNILTILGAGTFRIVAEQAGNAAFNPATAEISFQVKPAPATIALSELTQVYSGGPRKPAGVTSPAGLPFSISFDGSSQVPVDAGTYQVVASILDPNYTGSASGTFVIEKASQVITLAPVADKIYGDAPFPVQASSSSGLPVTLDLATEAPGIVDLKDNVITIQGVGSVTLTASQSGDKNHLPAAEVSDEFVIGKASQQITIALFGDKRVGDEPFPVSATATSGLPVTLTVKSGPATIANNTITLTGSTGTVVLGASQAGNAFYHPAPEAEHSFQVLPPPKLKQTISFESLPARTFGDDPFTVHAASSSGLKVAFSIVSGPAFIDQEKVTVTGAGTVVIEASQAGDESYDPALPVRQALVVRKAASVISFESIPNKTVGDPAFTLSASSSVGLPVNFSVISGLAMVNGSRLDLTGAGRVVIRAYQTGNKNYEAAAVERTFCVAPDQASAITGLPAACIGSVSEYSVRSVSGVTYTWTVTEGGTLSSNTGSTVQVNWTKLGRHTLTVTPSTDCYVATELAGALAVQVTNPTAPDPVGNMYPATGANLRALPFTFSWQPAANALLYDLYIWGEGTTEPTTPTVADITHISQVVTMKQIKDYAPGRTYNWRVVSRTSCLQTNSVVQTFSLSELPNLVVQDIQVPASFFSGQVADIAYEIKNKGAVSTRAADWIDAVYLSADTVLDMASDEYLGGKANLSALASGESYSNTVRFTLPESVIGKYYLFIETDGFGIARLSETNEEDNVAFRQVQINLTPPPDLQVTSVVNPGDAFSGQNILVAYTVTNKGKGITKSSLWKDFIYVSPDPEFDINGAVKIGEQRYDKGQLSAEGAYTFKSSFELPANIFGQYYIYVVTDAADEVYEFTFDNNNSGRNDSLNIFLTPPADFVITEFNAPDKATIGDEISLRWSVQNQGATRPKPKDGIWADAYFLSKEPVFNNKAVQIWIEVPRTYNPADINDPNPFDCLGKCYPPIMKPGETYHYRGNAILPDTLSGGTYYLYLITDYADNVFEYQKEDNNIVRSKIELIAPDLTITNIGFPASASSGSMVNVQWTVNNEGQGRVIAKDRQDFISISISPTYDPATLIRVDSLVYKSILEPGATISKNKEIKVPDGLSGRYYLFIETDHTNQISEGAKEGNNRQVSSPIQINLAPWPDLQVTEISLNADMVMSDENFAVRYKVANKGAGDVPGQSWVDRLYLSKAPELDPATAREVKVFRHSQSLLRNATYEVQDSLLIGMELLRKMGIDMVNCYFYLRTDAENSIYEHTSEINNTGRSQAVHVMHAEHADLAVTRITGPEAATSGSQAQVSWSVKNLGGPTGYYYKIWYDGVFISRDPIWDEKDLFVTDQIISEQVNKGGVYEGKLTFTIPDGLSGDYYLLLVADHKDYHRDRHRENNYKLITDPNGQPQPLHITLTPSPDLAVTMFESPTVGYSGQPVNLKWQVQNKGVGPTTKGAWTEYIYLSADDKVDKSDTILAKYTRTGDLPVHAAYRDSLLVFLPKEARGNYYILFKTDNNNVIYEHQAEDNNVAGALVFIIQPEPSDLIVMDVAVPPQAMTGDSVTVRWKVKNIGRNPASGYFKEGIYFSADSLWNKEDLLIRDVSAKINLAPLEEVARAQKVKVKGLVPGPYSALIRTDLGDNMVELNEENNVGASAQKLIISVPELPVNVLTKATLRNSEELIYSLEIPETLAGETMLIALKGDSVGGANELFVKYRGIPTRFGYDFSFGKAISGNQEVVIPALAQGQYYILVYGASARSSQQPIFLLARKINFGIHSIAAKEGGNTGSVTVKINGAKFESGMQVTLFNPQLGTITARTVKLINSTSLFASFNLAGAKVGDYDVRITRTSNESTALANGFKIIPGTGGGLLGGGGTGGGIGGGFYCSIKNEGVDQLLGVDVQHPDATRTRRVFPMTINFGNSGNVDIPLPTRILLSLNGHPIALSPEGVKERQTVMHLQFEEIDGPKDVLRPGATGSITIYTQAFISFGGGRNLNLRFRLVE